MRTLEELLAHVPGVYADLVDASLPSRNPDSVGGASDPCTMCGMAGETCLAALSSANLPCCTVCRDGNTHPAPGEAQGSCAEWAEANGSKQ